MEFALIFISPSGSTEKTTAVLADCLIKKGHRVKTYNIGRLPYRENLQMVIETLENTDVVGFGSPVFSLDMLKPMQSFLKELTKNSKKYIFKVFLYANYAGISTGLAFIHSVKTLRKANFSIIGGFKNKAPHFYDKKTFPTQDTKRIIEIFVATLEQNNYSTIKNERLKKIFRPKKILIFLIYPLAKIVGKKRELPIHINKSNCRFCLRCVKDCPVGAIEKDNTEKSISINFLKCIHCYNCVITCKYDAIKSPIEKIENMVKLNKKILGTEKPADGIFI